MNLVPEVIESQQTIKEHQFRIGNGEVIFRMFADVLQLTNHVIGEISNAAGGKRWQSGNVCRTVFAEKAFEGRKNILGDDFALPSTFNLDFAVISLNPHVGGSAKEGVSPDLLTAFHRLQKKGVRLALGDREKSADWRKKIDELDRQLVQLLNARAQAAHEIGKLKRNTSMPIYEPEREKTIFENVRRANQGPLPDGDLRQVYERIIDVMRNIQKSEIVPPGKEAQGQTEFDMEVND